MKGLVFCLMALFIAGNVLADGKEVAYEVNGEPFTGYMYTPENAGGRFVFLVHDWDGLTDYEMKRAEMLGDLGYTVFAADMFGAGVRPTETADKKKLTGALYGDRERMRTLLQGALAAAKENGFDPANGVAMGYCFGGAVVLELARSGENMKGFVSFHGGLKTPEGQDYSNTEGFILVLHGTADKAVSMDEFAGLAEELEATGIDHEMSTYAGAPHAFTVFGSKRYHAEADRKSWMRYIGYLAETL